MLDNNNSKNVSAVTGIVITNLIERTVTGEANLILPRPKMVTTTDIMTMVDPEIDGVLEVTMVDLAIDRVTEDMTMDLLGIDREDGNEDTMTDLGDTKSAEETIGTGIVTEERDLAATGIPETETDETTEVKTVTTVAEIALTIDVMGIVTVAIEIGAADMGETVTTIAGGVIATAVMAETATMIAEEVIDTMIAEGVIDTMIAEVATASTIVEVEIVMVTEIEGVIMMTAKEAHGVTLTVVVIQGATLIETKESLSERGQDFSSSLALNRWKKLKAKLQQTTLCLAAPNLSTRPLKSEKSKRNLLDKNLRTKQN